MDEGGGKTGMTFRGEISKLSVILVFGIGVYNDYRIHTNREMIFGGQLDVPRNQIFVFAECS